MSTLKGKSSITSDLEEVSRPKKKTFQNSLEFESNKTILPRLAITPQLAPAPRFVVPEFGAEFFDPHTTTGPWDVSYKLTLPPHQD